MAGKKKPFFLYEDDQMQKAIEAVAAGQTVSAAARAYNVPRTTLLYKVTGKSPTTRKMGPATILTEEQEMVLETWMRTVNKAGFPVSKDQLLNSVYHLIKTLNIETPLLKNGRPGRTWYDAFMRRHPTLSERTPQNLTTSRASVTKKQIQNWFLEVISYLREEGYDHVLQHPSRIFNADEAAFFLNPKGNKVIVPRGEKSVYSIVNTDEKECITALLNANADGQIAPPMVVLKYVRIPVHISDSIPPHWAVGRSPDSGWMTGECFFEYVTNVFNPWLEENNITKPIIFFVDGHTSHLTLHLSEFCSINGIILVALFPNATHLLQPMDVAVFRTLKSGWREEVLNWRLKNMGQSLKRSNFCPLLKKAIDSRVTQSTLQNGFRKCGIFPWDAEAVDFCKIKNATDVEPNLNDSLTKTSEKLTSKISMLEELIGIPRLRVFESCLEKNFKWNGDVEDTSLFELWRNLKLKESNSSQVDDKYDIDNISSNFDVGNGAGNFEEEEIENVISLEDMDDAFNTEESRNAPIEECQNVNFEKNQNVTIDQHSAVLHTTPVKELPQSFSIPDGVPSPFKKALFWPEAPKTRISIRKKKEKLPSVATSQAWQEYNRKKMEKKEKQNQEKEERKRRRDENKILKQTKKKRAEPDDSSDSSVEVQLDSEGEEDNWSHQANNSRLDSSLENIRINDYVIVLYDENYFPGTVIEIGEENFRVSTMVKSGISWKWPSKPDVLFYPKEDIMQKIDPPQKTNNRGAYHVPEILKFEAF